MLREDSFFSGIGLLVSHIELQYSKLTSDRYRKEEMKATCRDLQPIRNHATIRATNTTNEPRKAVKTLATKNPVPAPDKQEPAPEKKKVKRTGTSGQPAANDAAKYRAYPTDTQYELITKTIGSARYYWNLIYDLALITHEEYGVSIYPTPAEAKKWSECSFLAEADALALTSVWSNYQQAWKNHKDNPKHYNRPKRKRRHGLEGSYTTYNQPKWDTKTKQYTNPGSIRIENGRIRLPKLGWVKIQEHYKLPEGAIIKNVTVSRDCAGRVSVSIGYYNPELEKIMHDAGLDTTKDVLVIEALDYSNPHLFVDQAGLSPTDVHYYKQSEHKLAKLQKKLSRREHGSYNYKKLNTRIARLHRKIANQRKDLLHKLSHALAVSCDVVVVENLDLRAMGRHKKGGKYSFGKSVSDNAWGMFLTFLEYKLARHHGRLVRVGRYYPSSKKCHHCGALKDDLCLSDREWSCPECGAVHDRDVNAAWNIMLEGVRLLRSGAVAGVNMPGTVEFCCAGGMPVAAGSDGVEYNLSLPVFEDLGVVPVEGCETVAEVLKYCSYNMGLPKGSPAKREAGIKEVTTCVSVAGQTEAPSSTLARA